MGKFVIIKGANFSGSSLGEVTPVAPEGYMVLKLQPSPVGNGFVNGSGVFKKNSVTEILAEPASDFYMWGDGNTVQDRVLNVGNSNSMLRAFFKDGNMLSSPFNSSQLKWEKGIAYDDGLDDDVDTNWGRTQTLYSIPSASTMDFVTTFTQEPAIKLCFFDRNFSLLDYSFLSAGSLDVPVNKNIPNGAAYIRISVLKYGAPPSENFDVNWLGDNITFTFE